jgi:hypothetical protein
MLFELMASIFPAYCTQAGGGVSIFEWWVLIPQIIFSLAMPSYYSSRGYRFFDCFLTLAHSAASLLE